MKRTMITQLATAILTHPQAPELASLVAREAVAEAVDRLRVHQERRELIRAEIVREDA